MTYKARRTRDLQGEVQAGTNVSVSETTKPDGTKVYILSADSGEIPTLADMSNSLAVWIMTENSGQDANKWYTFIDTDFGIQDKQIEEIGEFYDYAISDMVCFVSGADTYYLSGVKFLKSGTYLITIKFPIQADTLCKPILYLKKETSDGTEEQIYDNIFTLQSDDEIVATITTYIDVNENDIVCPYMECDASFGPSNSITLIMQKVR